MWLLLSAWIGLAEAAPPEMIPLDEVDLVGRSAPPFEAELLSGGKVKLEDLRGKPVVLSFWASWCGPCREELPALTELAHQRPDVHVYAINVDRDPAMAKRFLAQVHTDLPIVWDPESRILGQYEVLSMPTMFVLDEHLTVKAKKVGYGRNEGLKAIVEALDARRK
jgi:thiol-disulfide isomerase/thioredoxin